MSWWATLVDTSQPPWCSYGTPAAEYKPEYAGDEPCPSPCYPAYSVPNHEDGGTYALGGTTEATLNVTYNYGGLFADAWRHAQGPLNDESSILARMLDGRRAGDVAPFLEKAVAWLGTEPATDYWAATPGNAGRALARLLAWAKAHPDGTFRVN